MSSRSLHSLEIKRCGSLQPEVYLGGSITKGVPSSGKVESNKSNSCTKLTSGPGGR